MPHCEKVTYTWAEFIFVILGLTNCIIPGYVASVPKVLEEQIYPLPLEAGTYLQETLQSSELNVAVAYSVISQPTFVNGGLRQRPSFLSATHNKRGQVTWKRSKTWLSTLTFASDRCLLRFVTKVS